MMSEHPKGHARRWRWLWLGLLLPIVATLWSMRWATGRSIAFAVVTCVLGACIAAALAALRRGRSRGTRWGVAALLLVLLVNAGLLGLFALLVSTPCIDC